MGLTDRKRDGYILLFKRKRYIIFIVSLKSGFSLPVQQGRHSNHYGLELIEACFKRLPNAVLSCRLLHVSIVRLQTSNFIQSNKIAVTKTKLKTQTNQLLKCILTYL